MALKRIRAKLAYWGTNIRQGYSLRKVPSELRRAIRSMGERNPKIYKTESITAYEFRWNKKSAIIGAKFMAKFPRTRLNKFNIVLEPSKFESPVCITIRAKGDITMAPLGKAQLNFAKIPGFGKSVLIEGLQGGRKAIKNLDKFKREEKKAMEERKKMDYQKRNRAIDNGEKYTY